MIWLQVNIAILYAHNRMNHVDNYSLYKIQEKLKKHNYVLTRSIVIRTRNISKMHCLLQTDLYLLQRKLKSLHVQMGQS